MDIESYLKLLSKEELISLISELDDRQESVRCFLSEKFSESIKEVVKKNDFAVEPLCERVGRNVVRPQGESSCANEFCIRLKSKVCKTRFPMQYIKGGINYAND